MTYYERNREAKLAYQKNRYAEMRKIFNTWKETLICSQCDETDTACLDFHHCDPSGKDGKVANMLTKSMRLAANELNKCIVVCANCHRKIHAHGILTKPQQGLGESLMAA